MKEAGSLKQEDVIRALEHAKIAEGPGGPAEMVPGQHHVRMNMYIAQASNGSFKIVKSLGVIDPKEGTVPGFGEPGRIEGGRLIAHPTSSIGKRRSCRAALSCLPHRSGRKNSTTSCASASGCSSAAKWPPLRHHAPAADVGVGPCCASERGGRRISFGNSA